MNSERTAQLQVALASYDLRELRVQKRYLQEQGTAIVCTCFCSGEKLLAQLRQGVRYDAVVLCSELMDLSAEQFVRQLYQLKERPTLLAYRAMAAAAARRCKSSARGATA